MAHLNVLKLPKKYQKFVWDEPLSVGHIRKLESFFTNGVAMATITALLDQAINQKLTVSEFEETTKPKVEEFKERRIEVAKEAIKEITPIPTAKLETPEDYDRAAKALIEKENEKLRLELEVLRLQMQGQESQKPDQRSRMDNIGYG